MSQDQIPLFPLRTILYPDSRLPLRIFEPRYLDMISRCMKEEIEFGIVLSREPTDPKMFETFQIGTLARIIDWQQGNDGLLGITTLGTQKFKIMTVTKEEDGLNIAAIEKLDMEEHYKPPQEFENLVNLLKAILDDVNIYHKDEINLDSASWVSFRFAEILPLKIEDKQKCLELEDPILRLNYLQPLIKIIRENSQQ